MDKLKKAIRGIRDFPKKGIVFRDITPVLADPVLLREAVERLDPGLREALEDLPLGLDGGDQHLLQPRLHPGEVGPCQGRSLRRRHNQPRKRRRSPHHRPQRRTHRSPTLPR